MSDTTEAPPAAETPTVPDPVAPRPAPPRAPWGSKKGKKPAPGPRSLPKRNAAAAAAVGPQPGPERAPAARDEQSEPDDGRTRTRVSRDARSLQQFELPQHRKKPGWDYQWWVHSVMGQPIDNAHLTEAHEGGWRPERAKNWPELCPGAPPDAAVERLGQRLYSRPMVLTQQAKQEDFNAANQQLMDKVNSARVGAPDNSGGGLGGVRGVRAVPLEFEVQGEAGTFAERSR